MSSLLLVLTFILSTAYAVPIETGSYIVYDYSLTIGERQLTGYISEEITRDYGNGSIRLRLEATMNDGVLTLEKDTQREAFQIPRLPQIAEGIMTYSRRNFTFTIAVERAGELDVSVADRSYRATVYRLELILEASQGAPGDPQGSPARLTASGLITTIQGSGVIYSIEGSVRGREGVGEFRAVLRDTNINLAEIQATSEIPPSDSTVALFASLLNREPSTPSQPAASVQASSRQEASWERAWVLLAVGLAALALLAIVPARRASRTSGTEAASKPHYV